MSPSSDSHPPWAPSTASRAPSWCAALLLSLGACSGDSIVSPVRGGDGGVARERACTTDPAAVRARRACTVDDQCPCGAHCELGLCKAECGAGVFACYRGEYCDTFGRCRPESERGKAVMRVPAPEGDLTLGASSLAFGAAGEARALEYVLSGVARAPVRFEVAAPYQVRCDPSSEWAAECAVASAPGETVKRVEVRVAPGTSPMPTALASLRAWWGHHTRAVTLLVQSAAMDASGLQGLYEGTATLNGGILGQSVSVPITASVFATATGTAGRITFTDPSTLFTGSTATWTGSLAVNPMNGNGTLTLPARVHWTDAVTADLPVGVLASAPATPYTFTRGAPPAASTLALTLPVTFNNQGASPMRASWSISLRRTGDQPSGAAQPAVPPSEALAAQPTAPSAWEAALAGSYRSLSAIPLAQGDAMLNTLANASGRPQRRLEACRPSLFANLNDRVNYLTRLLYEVPTYEAEPGEVTELTRFSGGADLNGPLPTRNAVMAALLAPFYTSVTSYWGLNARPQLVEWAFTASQTNTSATTLPCDVIVEGPVYSAAFCNQNIAAGVIGVSRCGYFEDLGWGRYLSDQQSRTSGAISASALRFEIDYGIPLVPPPTDPSLPTRRSCSRTSSAAVPFVARRYFDFTGDHFDRPANCAELTLCARGANSAAGGALDSSALAGPTQSRLAGTGDLRCEGGGGFAFELDLRRDAGVNVSSDELLTTCFRDLDRLRRPAPSVAAGSADTGAAALFGTEGCIDVGRFFLALTTALDDYKADRNGPATPPTPLDLINRGRNARVAHRLLQEWLALHGAIAVQAAQYAIVPDSIRGVHTDIAVPRGVDVVDRLTQGLALLLHPRVYDFLTAASGELASPDYRASTTTGATGTDGDPQRQHLMVQREQMLGALLDLVDPLLDTALRNNDRATVTRLERALRVVMVTRADDSRLHTLLLPTATTPRPTWEGAYQSAWTAVSGRLSTLLTRLSTGQALSNPLGIAPGEVPLYFSGDPAGPAARFTPVSDYLLGVGASSGAWAPAAVAQAQAAADAVTRSFRTLATRTYQTAQTVNDVNGRLEAIRNEFGGQVSSYCGGVGTLRDGELLEGWESAAGAPFDAGTCYLRTDDPVCRARFAAQAAAAQREAATPQIVISRDDVLNQLCISSRGYFTETTAPAPAIPLQRGEVTREPDTYHYVTIATRPIVFSDPTLDALGRMKPDAFVAPTLADPASATGATVGCSDVRPCTFDASSLCVVCRGLVNAQHDAVVYDYREPGRVTYSDGRPPEPASITGVNGVEPDVAANLVSRMMVIEAPVSFASVFNQVTRPYGGDAALAANTTFCRSVFRSARTEAPPSIPPPAVVDDGSCYRGSLGQSLLNIRGLAIASQIAGAQFDTLTSQYDRAVQTCNIRHAGAAELDAAQVSHNTTMTALRATKYVCDSVVHGLDAAKDCTSTLVGASGDVVLSAGTSIAFAVSACAFGATSAIVQIASDGLQLGMDESEQSHALAVQRISANTDYRACMNDAGQFLSGARAASLAVSQARQNMLAALYTFNQDLEAAQAAFDEGNARLATARARQNTPPEFDDPLDLNVQTYRRLMRVARRVTFLAVRAAEYELQTSLAAENDAIVAESPADLQVVIDQLRLTAATRRVRGSAPAETLTILSLRDHLLQLQDTSALPASEQTLTPTQRFRNLLRDPRYAVYDARGAYLGQGVPFAINPVGRQGTGASQGVSLLAGSDCAERVWSVNLSVLGTDSATQPLVVGNDERTFARLEIHKSNSFYSQWCDAAQATSATPYQAASFRPAVNLFQEPGVSDNVTAGGTVSSSGADSSFTRARVRAHVNVSRDDFETSAYVEGSSTELAGRGLFGSYVLFIPASSISTTTTTGATATSTPGLNLGLVNDILLRLDYVSVARPIQ